MRPSSALAPPRGMFEPGDSVVHLETKARGVVLYELNRFKVMVKPWNRRRELWDIVHVDHAPAYMEVWHG